MQMNKKQWKGHYIRNSVALMKPRDPLAYGKNGLLWLIVPEGECIMVG